ncbi:MAG: superoxide dismutase [Longimicrobiales bacterium]
MPYPFQLPELPYDFDALEPNIDARTMEIHHGKHHKGYTDKLNAALEKHAAWQKKEIEEILRQIDRVPEDVRTAVRNNGGGYANHDMFWQIMGPDAGGQPGGELSRAINQAFGSFEAFKEKLSTTAAGQFGSGWGWLVLADGGLQIYSTPNQDSPYMKGHTPILGVDVWEHAYYLKYQNKRDEYLKNWWGTVNWAALEARYGAAA